MCQVSGCISLLSFWTALDESDTSCKWLKCKRHLKRMIVHFSLNHWEKCFCTCCVWPWPRLALKTSELLCLVCYIGVFLDISSSVAWNDSQGCGRTRKTQNECAVSHSFLLYCHSKVHHSVFLLLHLTTHNHRCWPAARPQKDLPKSKKNRLWTENSQNTYLTGNCGKKKETWNDPL